MSSTQRFLAEASRAAGTGRYFRWRTVGSSLGFSAAETEKTMRALDERKLVVMLLDGDARLLDAGRQLATGSRAAPSAPPPGSRSFPQPAAANRKAHGH